MSEDLQSLLEKINRDGVEKARAEADKIVAQAKAKADALINEAKTEAAKSKAEADKAAADYADRAADTIRQAERDTILKIEAAVTAMLEKILIKDVDTALADSATAVALVSEAVKNLAAGVEITAGGKLAAALKAQFAAEKDITVITDEAMGTGFSVKTDGGRIEHAFTGEVIARELAKRLRPDLAALLK